ncbi:MAG: branched-chain amino acid ABC transporter permease [Candidatus Rokubacteria bacterium]|nr:branched-chain amino acid ABC transporter permease [Candidatus Rokubacteria bacterium]
MIRNRAVLGGVLALALAFPWLTRSQYVLHVATLCGLYVVLTLSLNLITGFCGQFSLGHAGFYGVGAYTAALLAVHYASPFLLNLAAAALVAGLLGFLIGLPTLRLGGIYLAMATLGFGEIIYLVLLNWLALTRGPLGIPAIPGPALLGLDLGTPRRQYYLALALAILTTAVVSRLVNSRFGEAIQAIREDEIAAEAMGVPTTRLKVLTFTVSAALAGVAGAFFAHYTSFISPSSFTLVESILVLSLLVFGGMGSIEGSIAGAVLLTVAPEVFRFLAEYRMVIYGTLLLGLIVFRPQGLLAGIDFGLTRGLTRQPT